MRNYTFLKWLTCCFIVIIYFFSCKKEFSYEGGITNVLPTDSITNATGTLKDSSGTCMNIIISGRYIQDTNLNSNNYIKVKANIVTQGRYHIYTDTINGCWFADSGTVTGIGFQSFILKGSGKPITSQFHDFTVHFNQSECTFSVPLQLANYIFNSPAGTCPVFKVNGMYHFYATLNAADTINIPVTVITPGSYLIQTPLTNGMLFSAQGVFTKAGKQLVTLVGMGEPTVKGISQMPLTINNTACSFPVEVLLDTSMYWRFTAEGYNYSGLLDSAYGVLGDTGIYIGQNMNRVFAAQLGGFDNNGDLDSSNFEIVISRLNIALATGIYYPLEYLGAGDWNGTFSFFIGDGSNQAPTNWLYSSSETLPSFAITVTSFDPVTHLLQGTFGGSIYKKQTVNDQDGPIVNITNGFFKTYMAY